MMALPEQPRAFRAIVHGRVQGVGFRYATIRQASRMGIRGTVKNTDNGCVEVVAEGDSDQLDLFQAWLERGPPGAHVRRVDVTPVPVRGTFAGFDVEF